MTERGTNHCPVVADHRNEILIALTRGTHQKGLIYL